MVGIVCAYLLEKRYFAEWKIMHFFFTLLFIMNSAQNNNEQRVKSNVFLSPISTRSRHRALYLLLFRTFTVPLF